MFIHFYHEILKAELISSVLLSLAAVEIVVTFVLEHKTLLQTAHLLFLPLQGSWSRDVGLNVFVIRITNKHLAYVWFSNKYTRKINITSYTIFI